MELEADIELYESDRQKIMEVARNLDSKRGDWVTFDGWAKEIEGRFADAGYKVDVIMGVEEAAGGVQQFNGYLRIVGRMDPGGGFDHEQQAAEVQAANGGRITGSGLWRPN